MRMLLRLGAVVTLSLALLELLVRASGIAEHLYTEPAFEPASGGSSWRYKPGFVGTVLGPTHVAIGPEGTRLADGENVTGTLRVAVFGDSMTFGQAVDSRATFCAQLETRLRPRWPALRVLNFGVQGHSLDMEVDHVAEQIGPVDPAVVVLVFGSDDLNPARAQSRVDRFGYLTKKAFGDTSPASDYGRALLRESRLALAMKSLYLQRGSPGPGQFNPADTVGAEIEGKLAVYRAALQRFDSLTRGRQRIVMCVDLTETALTRAIGDAMRTDFPHLTYVSPPPVADEKALQELRVPRDGHPNARAHTIFADLLEGPLRRALETSGSRTLGSRRGPGAVARAHGAQDG